MSRLERLIRYYSAGIVNTAFGFGLYSLLVFLGLNLFAAQIVAYVCGTAFNYFTYSRHVFTGDRRSPKAFVVAYRLQLPDGAGPAGPDPPVREEPLRGGLRGPAYRHEVINYFVLRRYVVPVARAAASRPPPRAFAHDPIPNGDFGETNGTVPALTLTVGATAVIAYSHSRWPAAGLALAGRIVPVLAGVPRTGFFPSQPPERPHERARRRGRAARFAAIDPGLPALAVQVLLIAVVFTPWSVPWAGTTASITLAFCAPSPSPAESRSRRSPNRWKASSSVAWFLANSLAARAGVGFPGSHRRGPGLWPAAPFMAATVLLGLIGSAYSPARLPGGGRVDPRPGRAARWWRSARAWRWASCAPRASPWSTPFMSRPSGAWAALATVVFLTTRFEAALYFAVVLGPLLPRGQWRTFLLMTAFGLMVFAAEEAWRWACFADWVPGNTIRYKMWPVLQRRRPVWGHPVAGPGRGRVATAAAPLLAIIAVLALVDRRTASLGSRLAGQPDCG